MRGLAEAVAGRGQGAVQWLCRQVSGPDYSPGPLLERIGALLAGAGLLAVADQLVEVDAQRAALILSVSLQFDLAYNAEVLPGDQVARASDAFFGVLGTGARFFTTACRTPTPPWSASRTRTSRPFSANETGRFLLVPALDGLGELLRESVAFLLGPLQKVSGLCQQAALVLRSGGSGAHGAPL